MVAWGTAGDGGCEAERARIAQNGSVSHGAVGGEGFCGAGISGARGSTWHRMRRRGPIVLFVSTLTAVSPGCSFMQPRRQAVSIMATDPTAEIFVNGASVGSGTASVELERDRTQEIMARTPDNRVGTATIRTRMSSAGIVDIIMGSLIVVPFFGLLSPGSHVDRA
jgi:hypothetical protein